MVLAMAEGLAHRGPNDAGAWSDAQTGVALGHRRLSIVDLSPAGHQPMQSPSGRYMMAFNGEIYNHLALRLRLGQREWRGHSDTETLLACFEAWGIAGTLKELVGMFAIALWDKNQRELTLIRDRMGEKPLYYGWQGQTFMFGSELKALRRHPAWRNEIDRDALASYMRFSYVPLPHSIFLGIRKLLPGTFLTLKVGAAPGLMPEPQPYWSAKSIIHPARRSLDEQQAVRELDTLLRESVAGQMMADVPLGAFLSGGIDSSTVVAIMQAQSTQPVHTFSIGFSEAAFDEAGHARAVAAHLGTHHTELYMTSRDALDVIPRLPEIYDEPFADSSQIPTHLVAKLACGHVTVALSGDGGDELFGGYNRYVWGRAIWDRIGGVPRVFRGMAKHVMTALTPGQWDRFFSMMPKGKRFPAAGDKLHKLAKIIDAGGPDELYRRLISQHHEVGSAVRGGHEAPRWSDGEYTGLQTEDLAERMMFQDLIGYMTDDILTKVDRAAMAVSLETRIPLLDHRLVEFAWSLPASLKIRGKQGKWLLRQVLYQYVPRELIERPKQGFAIPLDAWLRGPLRDWAENLLEVQKLEQEGFFDAVMVRTRWAEHLSGQRNWQHWLWNVLMFQAWKKQWA